MKKLLITATLLLLLSLKPLFAGVDKGIDVAEVQKMLTDLCFNVGPIDGKWGAKTEKAAEIFLFNYSGQFGKNELNALKNHHMLFVDEAQCPGTEEQEIQIADKNVCKIQELLSQQGYNVGLVDGVLGKKTTDSLTQFYAAQNKKLSLIHI